MPAIRRSGRARTAGSRSLPAVATTLAVAVALALAAGACGEPPDPLAPPEIVYGEDVCDACGMILSDERFAAATVVDAAGGPEPRRFDDIGEMFSYHLEYAEPAVLRWYVHDHDSLAWLDATTASYVRGDGIRSPMGSGLAAFATADRAAAFATEVGATVVSFDDLRGAAAPATTLP